MASNVDDCNNLIFQVVLNELSHPIDHDICDPVMDMVAATRRRPSVLLGTGRIVNYVEETFPTYSYPLFRAHFRITRTSFQVIKKMYTISVVCVASSLV